MPPRRCALSRLYDRSAGNRAEFRGPSIRWVRRIFLANAQDHGAEEPEIRARSASECIPPPRAPCDLRIHSLALWACTVGFSIHTSARKSCHPRKDRLVSFVLRTVSGVLY